MSKQAKFNIGDCVKHSQLGYRAVVVDIDPLFQASGRYNPQASKRPFATRNPWYRLLVDDSNQITYVEECQLEIDDSNETIDNPRITDFLVESRQGYQTVSKKH